MNIVDGSVFTLEQEFLDEDDAPISMRQGYPKVYILDSDKNVVLSAQAAAGSNIGVWTANLSFPLVGVESPTKFRIRWVARDLDNQKYTDNDVLIVEPKVEKRSSDVVLMKEDTHAEFIVPFIVKNALSFQVYVDNKPLYPKPLDKDSTELTIDAGFSSTSITLNLGDILIYPRLAPNLVQIRTKRLARTETLSYKMYVITPQIALAMTAIDDALNKARLENIIPSLQYTDADYVHYLERGLHLFNSMGNPTNFDGTNMQGPLYESWIICSSYYALSAQLIAEGSLAFDFSGQGVSLNVDRTPQLDEAIGRLDGLIQNTVLTLKKMLAKSGRTGGDGSVGRTGIQNPYAFGTLGMINAPTTRIRGFTNVFVGRRTSS